MNMKRIISLSLILIILVSNGSVLALAKTNRINKCIELSDEEISEKIRMLEEEKAEILEMVKSQLEAQDGMDMYYIYEDIFNQEYESRKKSVYSEDENLSLYNGYKAAVCIAKNRERCDFHQSYGDIFIDDFKKDLMNVNMIRMYLFLK